MTYGGLRAAAVGTATAVVVGGAVLAGAGGAAASDGRQLVGTWQVTVQPDGEPSSFVSTLVYTSGGSVVEATSRMPASTGLGTWDRLGAGRFATVHEKYRFEGGAFAGTVRVEETSEVAPDGDHYTARAVTTLRDAKGQLVRTFRSSVTAVRL